MANAVEKLNTIAIADIEKVNTLTDDNIEDLNTLEFTGVVPDWKGTRAIIMGGEYYDTAGNTTGVVSVQYKTLDSDVDTTDFGDLIATSRGGYGQQATGNAIKGEAYGYTTSGGVGTDTIQSLTIASTGNSSDDGNMLGVISANGATSGT